MPTKKSPSGPWYKTAFTRNYLARYKHRSDRAALAELPFLLRALKLPPAACVLDLCCGAGRHSRALTAAGFNVIGIDLSEDLLNAAKSAGKSPRGRRKIQYLRADMRRIPLPAGSIDGCISMFTSFGYFPKDSSNARVLREVARVLKPGAPFILDYFNLPAVLKNLVPYSNDTTGGVRLRQWRRYDKKTKRLTKKIEAGEGRVGEVFRESVRAYSPTELRTLLKTAGLKIEKRFGDLKGSKFNAAESPRCILLARKT